MQRQSTTSQKQTSTLPSVFVAERDVVQLGISLWSVLASCPSCVPSWLLACPGLLAGVGRVGKMKPWCSTSNGQQKPKHWCVISTVLATNPKCSTIMGCCGGSYLQTSTIKNAVFFNLFLFFWYFHNKIYFLSFHWVFLIAYQYDATSKELFFHPQCNKSSHLFCIL